MRAVYKKTLVETFQEIIQPYIDHKSTKELDYIELNPSEYKKLEEHYGFRSYYHPDSENIKRVRFSIGQCRDMVLEIKMI
jgi:hypothetical protein